MRMPLSGDLWMGARKRIGLANHNAPMLFLIPFVTERTFRTLLGSMANRAIPLVFLVFGTLPPNLSMRIRRDLLGSQVFIPGWMPLFGEFGIHVEQQL